MKKKLIYIVSGAILGAGLAFGCLEIGRIEKSFFAREYLGKLDDGSVRSFALKGNAASRFSHFSEFVVYFVFASREEMEAFRMAQGEILLRLNSGLEKRIEFDGRELSECKSTAFLGGTEPAGCMSMVLGISQGAGIIDTEVELEFAVDQNPVASDVSIWLGYYMKGRISTW